MIQLCDIRRVKRTYERDWLAINGVVGVGIGKLSTGDRGIIVSASSNLPEIRKQIPIAIQSIPIEIRESGPFKAY